MVLTVVATALGGPEVLALVDEPERDPGPGEVVVDVRAVGVNPVDYKSYGGHYGPRPVPVASRLRMLRCRAPRWAPTRSVRVDRWRWVTRSSRTASRGVYAARGRGAGHVHRAEAAQPGMGAGVGAHARRRRRDHVLTVVDVAAGDTVLFHGAAGGVGIAALQIARAIVAALSSAPRARPTTSSCVRSAPSR